MTPSHLKMGGETAHEMSLSEIYVPEINNIVQNNCGVTSRCYNHLGNHYINTLRTGSFKLFKRPFPGFLTILTL
jgi:hypothetical protein